MGIISRNLTQTSAVPRWLSLSSNLSLTTIFSLFGLLVPSREAPVTRAMSRRNPGQGPVPESLEQWGVIRVPAWLEHRNSTSIHNPPTTYRVQPPHNFARIGGFGDGIDLYGRPNGVSSSPGAPALDTDLPHLHLHHAVPVFQWRSHLRILWLLWQPSRADH